MRQGERKRDRAIKTHNRRNVPLLREDRLVAREIAKVDKRETSRRPVLLRGVWRTLLAPITYFRPQRRVEERDEKNE